MRYALQRTALYQIPAGNGAPWQALDRLDHQAAHGASTALQRAGGAPGSGRRPYALGAAERAGTPGGDRTADLCRGPGAGRILAYGERARTRARDREHRSL